MNISSRCEYACRAILELARHAANDSPLSATAIATRANVPEKYLVHIMLQLKREGIVRSTRGAQGGYSLGRPASEISLFDVVTAIEGPVLQPLPVEEASPKELISAWRDVADTVGKALAETTFQQMMDRGANAEMYYI